MDLVQELRKRVTEQGVQEFNSVLSELMNAYHRMNNYMLEYRVAFKKASNSYQNPECKEIENKIIELIRKYTLAHSKVDRILVYTGVGNLSYSFGHGDIENDYESIKKSFGEIISKTGERIPLLDNSGAINNIVAQKITSATGDKLFHIFSRVQDVFEIEDFEKIKTRFEELKIRYENKIKENNFRDDLEELKEIEMVLGLIKELEPKKTKIGDLPISKGSKGKNRGLSLQ